MKRLNAYAVVTGLALLLAAVALGAALYTVETRQDDIEGLVGQVQESRQEAALRDCRATVRERRSIVRFVEEVSPRLSPVVRAGFRTEIDCPALARRQTTTTNDPSGANDE